MAYQYRVVPFMGRMKGSGSANDVSKQLESVINTETRDGWEFLQLGSVDIQVSPGCLASLFGSKVSYMSYDQVIFRRSN